MTDEYETARMLYFPRVPTSMADRVVTLRGYIKEARPGRHIGVCLTLNLVVEGPTQDEALVKLRDLIQAYLEDAIEDGELDSFVPRRAPLAFYVDYWRCRFASLRNPLHAFLAFREARPLHMAHA